MSTVLIILLAVGIVLAIIGYFALLMRIYYVRVRNKGYANPLIALVFAAVILLSAFLGFVAMVLSHRDDGSFYTVLFLIGPVALATVALYVGARLLPGKRRIAGARKIVFPYALVGWILMAGGVGQFLYTGFSSHWKTQSLSNSLKLLIWVALPACYYCFYLAKRSRTLSADEVLNADLRPPVLYLRAFTYEEEKFVYLPKKEAAQYTSYLGNVYGATLEQYFSGKIRELIGPFVALGNPLDYAAPEGAFRSYERDENWQERFLNLARTAACIIIQVGDSRNLQWEFQALKREGLQEKVFIFTSPKKNLNAWNRFGEKCLRLQQLVKGAKRTVWPQFAAGLQGAGYEIDATEPPPGSVLNLSREGTAKVLTSGAQAPADFIGAMVERLQWATLPNTVGLVPNKVSGT